MLLVVREKNQQTFSNLIVLPDNKYVTSKCCLVLTGKDFNTGQRVVVLQYDRGIEMKAWEDLEFESELPLYSDKLPEGVTVVGNKINVAKDTPLQLLFNDDAQAELLEGLSIND